MGTVREWEPEELTKEEWLANRRHGIGASEAATVLGANPYQSPYSLWAQKRGLLPPVEVSYAMAAGHLLEPLVASAYATETGRRVEDPGDYAIYRHPRYPFLFATLDRWTWFDDDQRGPLELKTTGEFNAKAWANGDPPLQNQVQLQAQMAITNTERGSLAGLVGNRTFHAFDQERNDRLLAAMLPKLVEFWERVQNDDPPPVDDTKSTANALAAMYPTDTGEVVDLSIEGAAAAIVRQDVSDQIKELTARKREADNILKEAMADASIGERGYVRVTFKKQTRKAHEVKASTFRALRVTIKEG